MVSPVRSILCMVGCMFLYGAEGVEAATLSTATASFGCSDQGQAEASCVWDGPVGKSVATASAKYGHLSATALTLGGTYRNGGVFSRSLGSSYAEANFTDQLTFGIQSGFFRIPIEIVGTLSVSVDLGANLVGSFSASSRFQSNINGRITRFVEGTNSSIDPSLRNAVASVRVVDFVDLSIRDGSAVLNAGIRAQSECDNFNGSVDSIVCSAFSSFGSSLRLLGGSVLDDDGELIEGVFVSSQSGHDYLVGVPGHEVSAIPLPGSAWALLLGLSAFWWMSRSRANSDALEVSKNVRVA